MNFYILNTSVYLKKFDFKAQKCILLRNSKISKEYMVYKK